MLFLELGQGFVHEFGIRGCSLPAGTCAAGGCAGVGASCGGYCCSNGLLYALVGTSCQGL
jgi:hypothetical protein